MMIRGIRSMSLQLQPLLRMYRQYFEEFPLPDFLIIGAQKCGSTSLYSLLTQHPGIVSADVKEIHYFGNPQNRIRGEKWYRSHFFSLSKKNLLKKKLGYTPITGEATPDMHMPLMPKFVHELLPNIKLISIFRDPVDRAYSQYHHRCNISKKETASFQEAIAHSPSSIASELMDNEKLYRSSGKRSYITRGLYAEQLERWYQYYPKDQFHVCCSKEIFTDPKTEMQKLLKFLNMPEFQFDFSVKKNVGNYKSKMNEREKDYLTTIFRPHNQRLYELLGRDFGWLA